MKKQFVLFNLLAAGAMLLCQLYPAVAAGGTGSISITPASLPVGSSGNTVRLTYTAAAQFRDGAVQFTVPAGWPSPHYRL